MRVAIRRRGFNGRAIGRRAALVVTLVAALTAPANAAPRVVLVLAGDTPQLRAASAGLRDALGSTPIEVIAASADAAAQLKAAARGGGDIALVALGTSAAVTAAREAPALAAVDCLAARAAPGARAVPVDVPPEQQVAWLTRLLPAARYIGILYDPGRSATRVEALVAALRYADLNPLLVPVPTPTMLPAALARLPGAVDALLAVPDATVYSPQTAKGLLLFSFHHRLPLIGLSESWVKAGALYALDWDYREVGAFCGRLALQLLSGSSGVTPQPPSPHPIVNQRTADRLGLRWDQSLRGSFERVLE